MKKELSQTKTGLCFLVILLWVMLSTIAMARDTVADEFNTIKSFISNPPSSTWKGYAFSSESMPMTGERDPVDVLLRRTRTLLDEFNADGTLDVLDANLNALEAQNNSVPVSDTSARLALFREVEAVSRKVAFANPLLNFKDIVFLKRELAGRVKNNHMIDQYFGFNQISGGGIYILENAFTDSPTVRDVLENTVVTNGRFQGQKLNFGSFSNPSLSFDGKTIYFSHTETTGPAYEWTEESCFHIFRVNIDGTDLRQLTDGPVNDLFPYPLPSGRIVFCSDRRGGYGRCHERKCPSFTLYSANADGTDITILSAHETNEWHPSVDNDGMIVYTRWDYVDRGDDQAHHPWICYPDGRDARALQGNWKVKPGDSPYMEQHVRSIPNSHRYVATATPHHGQSFGSLVLIDPRVYDDAKMSPLKVLTPEAQFPEATIFAYYDWKFATAWALSERFYLCGYDPYGRLDNSNTSHALTLLDAKTGLKTTIYHDPSIPCYHPTPLRARTAPLIPHRVASGKPLAPGEIFDPSVYDNMPTTGKVALMDVYDSTLPFPDGEEITHLRIYEILPKTTWHHYDPHIGYAQEDSARRVLGTVPVEIDGSAYFTVSADTPIFFQALNADGVAVQSMRSLTYVKPGDTLTCAGCHEKQGSAPLKAGPALALQRTPSDITLEVEGSNPFSYPRLVQPVLDAKCASCHQQQGSINLSAGNYTSNTNGWYTSYLNLVDFAFFHGRRWDEIDYDTWDSIAVSIPGQIGAMASRLYNEVLSVDHHGLQLTDEEMRRLTLWLDSNSDFYGSYENTLQQSQGQVVEPTYTQVTGYQTVVNTTYGPAIPAEPNYVFSNNNGLSEFGSPLELAAPRRGGQANGPVTFGQSNVEILVEAGTDVMTYVNGTVLLQGEATIDGEPVVSGGEASVQWSQITGPAAAAINDSSTLLTSALFPQPGSYLLELSVELDGTTNSDQTLITVLSANSRPLVDAGSDQILEGSGSSASMNGFVKDDSDSLTIEWTQVSGPATVLFNDATAPDCTVTFPAIGAYVLRLTADDGKTTPSSDDCAINVIVQINNQPPTVSSGDDITTLYENNPITLEGSASDDGYPSPLTTTWDMVSGPGTVTFSDASSPATTADFSVEGYYLLQLSAFDGEYTSYDQLAVYLTQPDGGIVTGSITREYWDGISGNYITDLTNHPSYPDNPDTATDLASFQAPTNFGDTYASRIHGYLVPQVSGDYTFWIASDNNSELWLSSDDNPANVNLISSVSEVGAWTNPLEWDKYSNQESTPIPLVAGNAYYIMALHIERTGGDNLAVAWEGPGISRQVIDGDYLSPYTDNGGWQPPPSGGPVIPTVGSTNQAPTVSAGPDLEIALNDMAELRGSVDDDGLPELGTLTTQWQKVGGPGNVTFADAASPVTTAMFSEAGCYLLRLEATDSHLASSNTTLVTVNGYAEHDYFYPSPQEVAWSTDGACLAVADAGLNRVVILNATSQSVRHSIPVDGSPRGMIWTSANELWVCEYDAGTLALIDAVAGRVVRRITVGPKPYDVKYDSTRQRLVVTEYGLSKVYFVNPATGATVAQVPIANKAMYLTMTPDNSEVLVANRQPIGDARDSYYAAVVSRINPVTFEETRIVMPYGSTSLSGIAVSPDGNWAYVAHLLGRTHLPTTQLNDGWVLNNAVTILNLNTHEVYATVLLDALEEGAANPWGLTLSDSGNRLWVSASGVHELISLDLTAIHNYLTESSNRADIAYNMITLYENKWIERNSLPGKGPRGVCLSPDGNTLAIAAYFAGEVYLFDPDSSQVTAEIATGPAVPEHALRRGERLFFDGDICFQRWLSCNSCHPGARSDGLNWDLLNDGIGNAKNTKSFVYSTGTPPSMVTGVRPDVAVTIQAGFKFIQFQQQSAQDMQDAFDYLASLRPERSPYQNKQWMTPEALSGKAIFNNRCAACHTGEYFTDLQKYDVGTGHPGDFGPYDPVYDTPTLHELWNSAPYLHDGSAATLHDVLTTENSSDQHGVTSDLNSSQIDSLVAYMNQITGVDNWTNEAPFVEAGANRKIVLPTNIVKMAATASDEGLPSSTLIGHWELVSGPDDVVFSDPTAPDTDVTFMTAGEYWFEFRVNDGEITNNDTVRITVHIYAGDLTFDGKVNMLDLTKLSQGWQTDYDVETFKDVANDWLLGCY